MGSLDYVYCPDCDAMQLAETPECLDGHGAECPDRACVQCGAALCVDVLIVSPSARRRPGRAA